MGSEMCIRDRSKSDAAVSLDGLVISPHKFRHLDTIGHSINVVFPSNKDNVKSEAPFDMKRSGEFIITHSHLSIIPGKAQFTFNAVSKVRK